MGCVESKPGDADAEGNTRTQRVPKNSAQEEGEKKPVAEDKPLDAKEAPAAPVKPSAETATLKEDTAKEETSQIATPPPHQTPQTQEVAPKPPNKDFNRDSVKTRTANTLSKLKTDRSVRDKYNLGKTLGTGGFSVVRLAVDKSTKKEWACKIMKLPPVGVTVSEEENSREDIFKEIDLLCNVNHENVLSLDEFYVEGDKVYLITELLTGGELLDAVLKRGSYSEVEARLCFAQLLHGIEYLHSRNIVHRDLKLENLLLAKPDDISNLKIADFGLAKKIVGQGLQTICGTPQYVAPEILTGGKNCIYGPAVDMWSAGVVLFVLLGGYPPFWSDSEPQLFELIRKAKFSFDDPVWKPISDLAKDLICKLLLVDPSRRLTADAALHHPWITSQEAASAQPLTSTQDNLKKNFRPRFRAVVDAVIAGNRMGSMVCKNRSTKDVGSVTPSTEPLPVQDDGAAACAAIDVVGDGAFEGDGVGSGEGGVVSGVTPTEGGGAGDVDGAHAAVAAGGGSGDDGPSCSLEAPPACDQMLAAAAPPLAHTADTAGSTAAAPLAKDVAATVGGTAGGTVGETAGGTVAGASAVVAMPTPIEPVAGTDAAKGPPVLTPLNTTSSDTQLLLSMAIYASPRPPDPPSTPRRIALPETASPPSAAPPAAMPEAANPPSTAALPETSGPPSIAATAAMPETADPPSAAAMPKIADPPSAAALPETAGTTKSAHDTTGVLALDDVQIAVDEGGSSGVRVVMSIATCGTATEGVRLTISPVAGGTASCIDP